MNNLSLLSLSSILWMSQETFKIFGWSDIYPCVNFETFSTKDYFKIPILSITVFLIHSLVYRIGKVSSILTALQTYCGLSGYTYNVRIPCWVLRVNL